MTRFWEKVSLAAGMDACWEWLGCRVRGGYGQFRLSKTKRVYAHRFAYEETVGPIEPTRQLDHVCRNRGCVNPGHLDVVTNRENVLRGTGPTAINARKTICRRGHPLSGENLQRHTDGRRECRACARARKAA